MVGRLVGVGVVVCWFDSVVGGTQCVGKEQIKMGK